MPGGTQACRGQFEALCARDYTEAPAYAVHRMMVDAYALQHPAAYCASAKSFAAHLTGLCCAFEHPGDSAPLKAVQQWLNGRVELARPEAPMGRGGMTLADLPHEGPREDLDAAIRRWARAVWEAYAELHPLARKWTRQALAAARGGRR